jgi:hypothetical protein
MESGVPVTKGVAVVFAVGEAVGVADASSDASELSSLPQDDDKTATIPNVASKEKAGKHRAK